MSDGDYTYILTEQGQQQFNNARKDYHYNMALWTGIASFGGYTAYILFDDIFLRRFISSLSHRRKYSVGIGVITFGLSYYHGYKVSQNVLLKKKFKIRKDPDNILRQVY
jgi:hypothetical protein